MCSVGYQSADGRQVAGAVSRAGGAGLADLARRPHTQPHRTPDAVVAAILRMKHRHPSFGPKKIRDRLRAVGPDEAWPVDSTVGVILKWAGLVRPRRVRRRVPGDPHRLSHGTAAASLWSADFKGDFRVGTGARCYPLTVMDQASRYLLRCQGLAQPTTAVVQPWFTWLFHEYGLPTATRTDNGPPFASTALGGLSRLAAWWVRLGIRPERIRPGTPSENGGHERMHRALKAAVGPRPRAWLRSNGGLRRLWRSILWRSIIGRARMKRWGVRRLAVCMSLRPGRIQRSCPRLSMRRGP
ncbi:MAG: DDE-type integrase/transposase/recombinase, partial [Nitrospira sp.]|nr:DDE-type integrase/transposase/recombinase [Nitrospira sp.]